MLLEAVPGLRLGGSAYSASRLKKSKSSFGGRSGDRYALGDADGEELTHLGRSLAEGGFEVCQAMCTSQCTSSWLRMLLASSTMSASP